MLYQILTLVLEVVTGLIGGACLLRFYMQTQRVGFANPIGRLAMGLSDWLVLPLRRVLPAFGRYDTASLLGALLIELAQYLILWLALGARTDGSAVPVLALFGLARLAISGVTGLVIVYVLLSWIQSQSPFSDMVDRLCSPVLRPLRRMLPLVGGVDLSPLALLVVLQIIAMVLGWVQYHWTF
jgi:YggT family protein